LRAREFAEIQSKLADLHPEQNTFPAEELLELAAEAIQESGATTANPIEYEAIRERYLPEYTFTGKGSTTGVITLSRPPP